MDLELTAQAITDTITAKLRDEFPAWSVCMVFSDNRRLGITAVNTWWTATTRDNGVYGTICVKWTRQMRNNKPQMVVSARWGMKPGTFSTRAHKASFITVAAEMSNNGPLVEQLIRSEASNMGDPLEILTKKSNKVKMKM
jgi:hypothetical protein